METNKKKNLLAAVGMTLFACGFCFGRLKFFGLVMSLLGGYNTVAACALYALMDVGMLVCFMLCYQPFRHPKMLLVLLAVNLVYVMPVVIQGDLEELAQYILFTAPYSVCAAIVVYSEDGIGSLLGGFARLSNVFFAFALLYIGMLWMPLPVSGWLINSEYMSYGDIAYFFLPVFMTESERFLSAPGRKSLFSGVKALVFITAIVDSGTRSAMLCMGFVLLLLLLKNGKRLFACGRIQQAAGAVIAVAWIVCSICILPPNSRLSQISGFIYDFSETGSEYGDLPVYDVARDRTDTLDRVFENYIVQFDSSRLETEEILREDIRSGAGQYIQVSPEMTAEVKNFHRTTQRDMLWRTAIMEFMKSPLLGNGPMFYVTKYDGMFPHCILLEILADFGLAGFGCVLALAVCFLVLAAKRGWFKNERFLLLLIFILMYVPMLLLYTTVYSNGTLLFDFTVMLLLCFLKPAAADYDGFLRKQD